MNHPYTYRYPLPFQLPCHLGYHSALGRVRVLYSMFVSVVYFIYCISNICVSIPASQFLPPHSFPPWYTYICSLHLCLYVSIYALCIDFCCCCCYPAALLNLLINTNSLLINFSSIFYVDNNILCKWWWFYLSHWINWDDQTNFLLNLLMWRISSIDLLILTNHGDVSYFS